MAYRSHIKEKAFRIYAGTTSYEDTAAQMRKIFPKECGRITKNTIGKWAIDPQLNWQGRIKRIKKEIAAATDKDVLDDRLQTLAKLRVVRDDIFHQLKGQKMKSLEGGAAALRNVIKSIEEMNGGSSKLRVNIDKILMVIFNVIGQDDKLKSVLAEKQEYLVKRIEEELGENANA